MNEVSTTKHVASGRLARTLSDGFHFLSDYFVGVFDKVSEPGCEMCRRHSRGKRIVSTSNMKTNLLLRLRQNKTLLFDVYLSSRLAIFCLFRSVAYQGNRIGDDYLSKSFPCVGMPASTGCTGGESASYQLEAQLSLVGKDASTRG